MRIKNAVLFFVSMLLIIMPLITGCGSGGAGKQNYEDSLKNDAVAGLKGTYAEDFSQLTIIRGALYKFIVNPQNPQHLGTAIGALEASVFPEEYELKRFDRLDNMTAEMRKEIISQPLLAITLKKRETLNHIYNAVLRPLSTNIEKGKQVTPQETIVLNNLISLLDVLVQNYSVLSNTGVDFSGGEAQGAFISIQNTFREMQNLNLLKQAVIRKQTLPE